MNNGTLYISVGDLQLHPAAECEIVIEPLGEPVVLPLERGCHVLTDEELLAASEECCQPGYSGLRSTCDITMEGNIKADSLFTPHKRYPRRLKKAISQICSIRVRGDRAEGCISLKQRTRWQRKAMRMVEQRDGYLTVPMVNGLTMTVKY